jgi:Tfp pilus assembly protein PilE
MFNKLFNRRGYTIDQTILIVAIIAILITLIIVTIGWQLINRTSGTKLAAQLRQMEDAAASFYSSQRVWPDQGLNAPTPTRTVALLANALNAGAVNATITAADLRNQLPGFNVTNGGTVNATIRHNLGAGGLVSMFPGTTAAWQGAGTNTRFEIVEFAGVAIDQALEADRSIDNAIDNKLGRVVYSGTTSCVPTVSGAAVAAVADTPTTGTVFVCYVANVIN